jgi:hypothetical protein
MVAQTKDPLHSVIEISDRDVRSVRVITGNRTSPLLSVPFLQTRSQVTLAADATLDSNVITLVGGHGVTVGEIIEMAEDGTNKFMQSEVVSVVTNTITLDQPVNRPYPAAGTSVFASNKNMLVDGSVTPVVFSILPLATQAGDMIRIILEIRGATNGAMDFTTFGSEATLTNGCVIRIKNEDGTFTNRFNFKSNSDFIEQGLDHKFLDPKVGNTVTGLVSRVTWGGDDKHGAVIRLDGSKNEELQIIIQDDLTGGNTRFHLTAQGHELVI